MTKDAKRKLNTGKWFYSYVDCYKFCDLWLIEKKTDIVMDEAILNCLQKWNFDYGMKFYLYDSSRGGAIKGELYKALMQQISKYRQWLFVVNQDYQPDGVGLRFGSGDERSDEIDKASDAIRIVKQLFCSNPYTRGIQLFVSAHDLPNVETQIEDFLSSFVDIERALFPCAGVFIKNTYYFIDATSSYLYALDINNETMIDVVPFAEKGLSSSIIERMVQYNGQIWMIPKTGSCFYVFDSESRSFERLPIPYSYSEKENETKFVSAYKDDNVLWVTSYKSHVILRIDMSDKSCKVLTFRRKDIRFDQYIENIDFHDICTDEKYVYFLRAVCNKDIRIDKKTLTVETVDIPVFRKFCMIKNGYLNVIPTKDSDSYIRRVSMTNGLEDRYPIPEEIKQYKNEYLYDYAVDWKDKVFFIPYSAREMAVFDSKKKELIFLNVTDGSYAGLRDNDCFSAKEAYVLNDRLIVPSYLGNQILLISENDYIERIIKPRIKLEFYPVVESPLSDVEGKIVTESNELSLDCFIGKVLFISESEWRHIEKIDV